MHLSLNQRYYQRMVVFLALAALVALSGFAHAASASWSFAVLGDQRDNNGTAGVNTAVIKAMVKDINSRGVTLAVLGGDQIHGIASTGSPDQTTLPKMYKNWRSAMGKLLRISYPVRGNHEISGEKSTPFYPYYWRTCVVKQLPQIPKNGPPREQGLNFSFSKNNAFFVGLDNFIPGNENRVNQSWLDWELAANVLPHLFVFGHEPAVAADPILPNMAFYPLERDAFWESLSDAGAQVYLSGHHHLYNRATVTITDVHGRTTNPITQMIVGAGGAPFEPWLGALYPYVPGGGQPAPPSPESVVCPVESALQNQYGYAIVTVDGNHVSMTYYAGDSSNGAVPASWQAYDTFSYTVSSKTLGLKDVNQVIGPEILEDYYPGIAIDKVGAGVLTLDAGTSAYSEPIRVSAGQMRVYGSYADAPVSVKSGGQATLFGGSLSDVAVEEGGSLVGGGAIADLINDGYVSPDLITGPWSLNVAGDFRQNASGNFNVDMLTSTTYGQMNVSGAANLSGALYISFQASFSPQAGQTFPNIITASGGVTGTFSNIICPEMPQKLQWTAIYNGNSVSLQAVATAD